LSQSGAAGKAERGECAGVRTRNREIISGVIGVQRDHAALTVEGRSAVIESILFNSVWTLSPMLSWLPVAPEVTKVIGLPLTVMVSLAAKLVASESVFGPPDNSVRAG